MQTAYEKHKRLHSGKELVHNGHHRSAVQPRRSRCSPPHRPRAPVGDCTLGVLRVTSPDAPGFSWVAWSALAPRRPAPASALSVSDAAAARFDALVSAAVEVSL